MPSIFVDPTNPHLRSADVVPFPVFRFTTTTQLPTTTQPPTIL